MLLALLLATTRFAAGPIGLLAGLASIAAGLSVAAWAPPAAALAVMATMFLGMAVLTQRHLASESAK